MHLTGWSKSLEVTADGQGIVSHAGLALLRQLADKTGLTGGLSRALASPRLLIHDRGRVIADLACAIADGGEVISDFRVLTDQKELSAWSPRCPRRGGRSIEIAAGGPRALARITKAVNAARRQAWAAHPARLWPTPTQISHRRPSLRRLRVGPARVGRGPQGGRGRRWCRPRHRAAAPLDQYGANSTVSKAARRATGAVIDRLLTIWGQGGR